MTAANDLTITLTPRQLARLSSFAKQYDTTDADAVARLIDVALRHLDAGRRGGLARARKLSPAKRRAIAKRAAAARWAPEDPR